MAGLTFDVIVTEISKTAEEEMHKDCGEEGIRVA
jgi:hypothetical protein